jgi:hypothetical protein
MSREAHVQFWEGLAVRFRRATQLFEGLRICRTRKEVDRPLPDVVQPAKASFKSVGQDPG